MTPILILDCEREGQAALEELLLRSDDPEDAPIFEPALPEIETAAVDPLLLPVPEPSGYGQIISEAEMIALWGSLDFLLCTGCEQASVTSHGNDLL